MNPTVYKVLANPTSLRNKIWKIGQKEDRNFAANNQAKPSQAKGNPLNKTHLKQTALPTHPFNNAHFLQTPLSFSSACSHLLGQRK